MLSGEIKEQAAADGFSWSTVRRAKKKLNAGHTPSGYGKRWVWFLPDVIRTEPTVLPKPDPDFPVLPKENVLGNTDNTGETMVNTDAQDPGIVI